MTTGVAISPDGARIAYERCGAGPAVLLLHGGGSSRREWHTAGYVARLQDAFTVITPDLRGHGESSPSSDPADYAVASTIADLLAVVDACGVERFALCGMSHGGKAARYLAVHTGRVEKLVLMSAPLGPGASPGRRQEIAAFTAHWRPILQAQADGTLDVRALSPQDQEFLASFQVASMLGWGPAMLDWPPVQPAAFRCPVLWLAGSEDQDVMDSVRAFEPSLAGTPVRLHVFPGLDHGAVFEAVEQVFPHIQAFLAQ